MKRGYRRLLIFNIIMLTIFLLNSFLFHILSRYNMVIFLIISLFAFYKLFGFEKDRHRYVKDIMLDIIIFLFAFFILYYLLGIIVGFAKTNYYTIEGIKTFIIPIILYVILREVLRYMMLCKAEGSKLLNIIIVVVFIFMDVTTLIYKTDYASVIAIFKFVALYLLPAISANIVFHYVTKKVGYKPIILYALIIELYRFLLPIIPNPGEYIVAVVKFMLPAVFGYRVSFFFKKEKDEDLERVYKKGYIGSLIFTAVFTIVLVYFTSGYFHYHAIEFLLQRRDSRPGGELLYSGF